MTIRIGVPVAPPTCRNPSWIDPAAEPRLAAIWLFRTCSIAAGIGFSVYGASIVRSAAASTPDASGLTDGSAIDGNASDGSARDGSARDGKVTDGSATEGSGLEAGADEPHAAIDAVRTIAPAARTAW